MSLLVLSGVAKSYPGGGSGRHLVLDGIDLAIAPGESLALLGASGSGKSTLGRLVLGLEAPDAGTILWRGRPWPSADRAERKKLRREVQVVFQDSIGAVDPRQRIGEVLAEPLRHLDGLSGTRLETRVAELLLDVDLAPGDAGKLPGQMSGGQLQRVCIARALAPRPALVVLDEAVSNLDTVLQVQMLDLLTDLGRRSGTAYLFITHDIRLARRFCRRIAVLDGGRIVEEIATAPGATFTHPAARALADAMLPMWPVRRRAGAVE